MASFTGGNEDETFSGTQENDTANGNGGNDDLAGGSGSDTLDGGTGSDILYSDARNVPSDFFPPNVPGPFPLLDRGNDVDRLAGGADNDIIYAGFGDFVDGGEGDDILSISFLGASSGVRFDMRQATNMIGGATISSVEAVTWIEGSNHDDYIDAYYGVNFRFTNDAIYGLGGNDELRASYFTTFMDGGTGNDIVDARAGQYIREIRGGDGDDILHQSIVTNATMYGDDGNDTIYGRFFNYGGSGDDLIFGSNLSYGEEGNDDLRVSSGAGRFSGGAGADRLTGGAESDLLSSADLIDAGTGTFDLGIERDIVSAGESDDIVWIGVGDDADGGTGRDELNLSFAGAARGVTFDTATLLGSTLTVVEGGAIVNFERLARLRTSEFADTITVSGLPERLSLTAGGGDDVVRSVTSVTYMAGSGDDRLISGGLPDTFSGSTGRDTVDYQIYLVGITANLASNTGMDGDVLISVENVDGSGLADQISGSAVDNMLNGRNGDDVLSGLDGNDVLDGGAGVDQLTGGLGNDDYIVDASGDLVFENVDQGIDSVNAGINHYLYANVENLTLTGTGNLFGVGNELGNSLTGNAGENLLIAGAGIDIVRGGDARDAIFGEGGDDALFGEAGVDYIVAGIGNDSVDGGVDADEIYGETGDDVLNGGVSFHTDIIVGGDGHDTIHGDSGFGDFDFLYGDAGNDIFHVDTPADLVFESFGEGTDTVFASINGAGFYLYDDIENLTLLGNTPFGVGNALANTITGNAQGNYLLGGAGNDILNGLGGGDVLFGQAGADTFVFGRGTGGDVIGDYARGTDQIDLRAFGFTSFAELQSSFAQNGNDGAIILGNGDLVVLHGVTMTQLVASDFVL